VDNRPLTHIDPDGQFAFLIPIAISLAIDLCLPTATAYLAEYAGGAVAAFLLTGLASGYNDPVFSVFSADIMQSLRVGFSLFKIILFDIIFFKV
jgi:hypothetical protein